MESLKPLQIFVLKLTVLNVYFLEGYNALINTLKSEVSNLCLTFKGSYNQGSYNYSQGSYNYSQGFVQSGALTIKGLTIRGPTIRSLTIRGLTIRGSYNQGS